MANKKQCGVRVLLRLFGGGLIEFSTLVADLSSTKDLSGAKGAVLSVRFGVLFLRVPSKMLSPTPVPVFDGKAENFASYQQEVGLWMMITQVPMNRRAPCVGPGDGQHAT